MKYDGTNFEAVIKDHAQYLKSGIRNQLDPKRAYFADVDMSYFDFLDMNLSDAVFSNVKLHCADFRNAILNSTCMYNCDLNCANLEWAQATFAHFNSCKFEKAYLANADFRGADFMCSDLSDVITSEQTIFLYADFRYSTNVPEIPMACPEEGSFIAWKKCRLMYSTEEEYRLMSQNKKIVYWCIVKLLIPEDAIRSSGTGRKCRANKAKVIEIYDSEGNIIATKDNMNCDKYLAVSMYDDSFKYLPGEIVRPKRYFNTNRWQVCSTGIHFFMTKKEAINYIY